LKNSYFVKISFCAKDYYNILDIFEKKNVKDTYKFI